MSHSKDLELELERRLTEIETEEAADPVHARLSGKSIGLFLAVVIGVVAISWIGATL